LAVVALALLGAIFAAQTWGRAMRANGNDLTTYLTAARAFWEGGNPYLVDAAFPFIYPLFLCVAIWPLALLPYGIAVAAWYLLAAVALASTTGLLRTLDRAAQESQRWLIATAVVALALADVLQNNLVNGQVNPIVLALCVAFAWFHARRHRLAAGAALGAAIAIKITPAILLLYLVKRKDWRTIAWTVAALVVCGVVLPYLIAGPSIWSEYQHYAQTFLTDRLVDTGEIVTHRRAFGLVEVVRQITGSARAADIWIAATAVAIALWFVDRTDRPHAFALYLAASLLISPMSEVHHLIYLWPALVLLAWEALDGRLTAADTIGLVAVLIAALAIRFVPFAAFAAVAGTCVLLARRRGAVGPARLGAGLNRA
jgi:alpha-1,2-mannosyltransferase